MTLIHDLELDILKMYIDAKSEVSKLRLSKFESPTSTDTQNLISASVFVQ